MIMVIRTVKYHLAIPTCQALVQVPFFSITRFKEENKKHVHIITMQGKYFLTFLCLF